MERLTVRDPNGLHEQGSARQVLLLMKADQIHFPRPSDGGRMTSFIWNSICADMAIRSFAARVQLLYPLES